MQQHISPLRLVVTFCLWFGCLADGFAQEVWTLRFWSGNAAQVSVVWTGTQLVSVGIKGSILASSDGTRWDTRNSGTKEWLTDITWSGEQLVAVGTTGTVLTSVDGVAWTPRGAGTTKELSAIAWSGSRFLAVGMDGVAVRSPDGIDWTPGTTGTTAYLTGLFWTGDQFVAVGLAGEILASPDGIAWTPRQSNTTKSLLAIARADSLLVAVGADGTVLTSADGSEWTRENSGTTDYIENITWTGTQLVAVCAGGTILTSPDGIAWKSRPLTLERTGVSNVPLMDIVWTGTRFVAVGEPLLTSSPESKEGLVPRASVRTGPVTRTSSSTLFVDLPPSFRGHESRLVVFGIAGNTVSETNDDGTRAQVAIPLVGLGTGRYGLEVKSSTERTTSWFNLVR